VVVGECALAHEAVGDGYPEAVDQRCELRRCFREEHTAASIDDRPPGAGKRSDDCLGSFVIDAGRNKSFGVGAENTSIGTFTRTGPGWPLAENANAFSMISGKSSARSTRHARFTKGR
jgi:hypothetical protein